jgi:hypothetical protein
MPDREDYTTREECIGEWYGALRSEGRAKRQALDQALGICYGEFPEDGDG